MGISAVVRVDGLIESGTERDALLKRLAELEDAPTVTVRSTPQGECIEVYPGVNYYEPGFARGHWPRARSVIDAVKAALPGREVYYGHELHVPWGDPDGFPNPLGVRTTDEMLAEHDDTWAELERERDADEAFLEPL